MGCGRVPTFVLGVISYVPAFFLLGLSNKSIEVELKESLFLQTLMLNNVANTRDTCPLSADKIISYTIAFGECADHGARIGF